MEELFEIDAKFDKPFVKADTENKVYLQIIVKGKVQEEVEERAPIDCALILDRSGSMAGDKVEKVKQASLEVAKRLHYDDRLALVTYSDDVRLDAPLTFVEKEKISSIIRSIYADGMTNLSGGVERAISEITSKKEGFPGRSNYVLLLTDGLANVGITHPEGLIQLAKNVKSNDIWMSTVGVGEDVDEELLQSMAKNAGGNYYFIEKSEEIEEVFVDEIGGMMTAVANGMQLTLNLAHKPLNLLGLEGRILADENKVIAPLGSIRQGETRQFEVEMDVPPYPDGSEIPCLLSLEGEYFEVGSNEKKSIEDLGVYNVNSTIDDKLIEEKIDTTVVSMVSLHETALASQQAYELMKERKFEEAKEMIQSTFEGLESIDEMIETEFARDLKDQLKETEKMVEEAEISMPSEAPAPAAKKAHYSAYRMTIGVSMDSCPHCGESVVKERQRKTRKAICPHCGKEF